ncbi:MAG TPA: cold-shock protein [Stellaceae bacterium]|jgi:CspA family cold shock protein|nr:cold-shock protein [Stellaceae bacterium]
MALGTVKWFSAEKGFGFIAPMDGSEDVRVDTTALEHAGLTLLTEGQRVRYEVVTEGLNRVAERVSLSEL